MLKLTTRQEEILAYVKEYMQETGYPPTRSEIASTKWASSHRMPQKST